MDIFTDVGVPILITYVIVLAAVRMGLNMQILAITVDILEKTMRMLFFMFAIRYIVRISHESPAPEPTIIWDMNNTLKNIMKN
jgi:hypothetical protein